MDAVTNLLKSWETWVVVGLFFLTFPIMGKIEEMMITKDTLYPAIAFLIPVIAVYLFFVKPTISKK